MSFLLGSANSAVADTYNITNSLRFGVNTDLKRLPSATGQSVKGTLSVWVKFATADTEMAIIGGFDNSGANDNDGYFVFKRLADGNLQFEGGDNVYLETTALYRDVSAWYHIVLAIDSGNSTANNKQRIYVNGVEITAFDTRNNLTNLQDLPMNTTAGNDDALLIGCDEDTGGKGLFFDGYMSEFYWIDQNQYAASDFGEYNSDGIWVPKEFEGSFGVNGVFLQFKQTGTSANTSGMGADTGGSTLHFTATNLAATDVCVDTPTNNFCTLNPLSIQFDANGGSPSGMVHGEGNTQAMNNTSSGWGSTLGTFLIPTSGKWYWELKNIPGDDNIQFGVMEHGYRATTGAPLDSSGAGWGWYSNDGGGRANGSASGSFSTWKDANDQVMIAYNANNGKLWLGKDGTWETLSSNVGDPAGDNYPHLTVDSAPVTPCLGTANINSGTGPSLNFGNPAYALSSAVSDANGYGDFEYAPPSGFYALCTKNLAEFG